MKRAVIYVRVSSEQQSFKVSPEAQEADCRAYCLAKGYEVVTVYRDIEKYRVKGRLVEPSGTRNDRPGFRRMLADNDAGKFEVLVCWREDRLYRSVTNSVIEILDRIKTNKLAVEAVNGSFDSKTAALFAWAAGIELEAKQDRYEMGMRGRAEAGKLNLSNPPFGYSYDKEAGRLVINEAEAVWVRQIWGWRAEGMGKKEIRERLVTAGAPQRDPEKSGREHPWNYGVIDAILRHDYYATGVYQSNRKGHSGRFEAKTYETAIPILIDVEVFAAVQKRKDAWKRHPAGNTKERALVAGKIFCEGCGCQMGPRRNKTIKKSYGYYLCHGKSRGNGREGCVRSVYLELTDEEVWSRIKPLLSEPGRFKEAIRERAEAIRAKGGGAEEELRKFEKRLGDLKLKRQNLVSAFGDGTITQEDLKMALAPLTGQEAEIQRGIAEAKLLIEENSLDTLSELLQDQSVYGKMLVAGPTVGQRLEDQFIWRRKIVEAMVSRVVVSTDKSIQVELDFNVREVLDLLRKAGELLEDEDSSLTVARSQSH